MVSTISSSLHLCNMKLCKHRLKLRRHKHEEIYNLPESSLDKIASASLKEKSVVILYLKILTKSE